MARGDVRLSVLACQYVRTRAERREFTGATPRSIKPDLLQFARMLGDPPVRHLTRERVEWWKAELAVADSSVRTKLSRVRNFCQWLVIEGYLSSDPTLGIKAPRKKRRSKRRAQPADAVAALFAACPDTRARLIVSLMVQEGLRCSSVAWLRMDDVDAQAGTIHVRLKGGHEGELPLTRATQRALAAYLSEYRPVGDGPLIRNQHRPHTGLQANYISKLVSRWFDAAGVKQYPRDGVSAQALRHTALTDVVDLNGGNVKIGSEMACHADGSTIWEYIEGTDLERLREAMEGRDYLSGDRNLSAAGSLVQGRDPPKARESAPEGADPSDCPSKQYPTG